MVEKGKGNIKMYLLNKNIILWTIEKKRLELLQLAV